MSGESDEAEERAFLASIDLTPIPTVITNPRLHDNPIVAANAAFSALTGYPKDEVIGRNCRVLGGPATEEQQRSVLRDAVAMGRSAFVELTNYRASGALFRNAVMIAPVRLSDGTLAYFVGSQIDVGEADTLPPNRRAAAEASVASLTQRQRQVLEFLIQGYRNKQIAGFLGIDEKTVKMHRARLLEKLGAATSADAIRIGVEAGLQL